jgi:hypothetical protein
MARFAVTLITADVFDVEAPDELTLRKLLEARSDYVLNLTKLIGEPFRRHLDEADPRVAWLDHVEYRYEFELRRTSKVIPPSGVRPWPPGFAD